MASKSKKRRVRGLHSVGRPENALRGSELLKNRSPATSRVTSKGQATIPASIRKKLDLQSGDTVAFEQLDTGAVLIRKMQPLDREFLSALETTLSEWNSENDEEAYRDL